MSKEIHITIPLDGPVKIDVQGDCGSGCADLTRAIEQDLGSVASDVKKPEYTQRATSTQTVKR
jgi:hypothetical protein